MQRTQEISGIGWLQCLGKALSPEGCTKLWGEARTFQFRISSEKPKHCQIELPARRGNKIEIDVVVQVEWSLVDELDI